MFTQFTSNFTNKPAGHGPVLVHTVYFELHEPTAANTQKLIDACHKYLSGHPGVTFFSAGGLVEELNRPVNVRDFQVALTVAFATKADHDVYQTAPRHLQFIEENKSSWAKVRVFDAWA